MCNHRVASCAATLSLMLLLIEPVIDAAQSLIINETIEVQGKKIGMQMFTLQCPLFDAAKGWKSEALTYTFHLIDKRALPSGIEPRVQAHGYYSFKQNEWRYFASISENRVVLDNESQQILAYYKLHDGRTLKFGDCGDVKRYIDRNTLDVVYYAESGADRRGLDMLRKGDWDPDITEVARAFCASGFPRSQTEVRSKCTLVTYQAPPERIGF